MNRRSFLKRLGWGLAALSVPRVAPAGQRPARQPNVVLILVDDMGWADLGCYGSRYYETPHIDRLARQGVRFTDAYAACTVCSPSRAAVLTGRYPVRHGITTWIRPCGSKIPARNPEGYQNTSKRKLLEPLNHLWMEHEEVTLAEVLKATGYATCHVGKWHLGPEPWHPETQGFDHNIGGCDMGHPPSYFDPYKNRLPNLPSRREGEYLTDREADEAVRFIRNHRKEPFFLYMSHYAVHAPLQSKQELTEKYQAKPPTEQKNPIYAGMVESVDDATGKILAALDDMGLANDTLVIFTSDNGGVDAAANGHPQSFYTHNGPLRMGKCWPYEGGIRVPAIVRWPGVVASNTVNTTPICGIDLLPTICAATRVAPPADRTIDGENLMPLLSREESLQRDALYWHFPHYQHAGPNSIIRSGPWKLIKWYETNTFELFNLQDDLGETTDLAGRMPDRVKELDRKLQAWLADTQAKPPRKNPTHKGT